MTLWGNEMERPKLRPRLYKPEMSKSLRGYAYNLTRRYWPKLMAWYEWDDLMQESLVVFLICQRQYTGVVDNPAWFMALFKTAWRNRLNTLIGRMPRYSLIEGLESSWHVDTPEHLLEAAQALQQLPVGSRLALIDLTRATPRLGVGARRRMRKQLKQQLS